MLRDDEMYMSRTSDLLQKPRKNWEMLIDQQARANGWALSETSMADGLWVCQIERKF